MVSFFCSVAGVSRNGYYAYLKAEEKRELKEKSDLEDLRLIKEVYDQKNKKVGALQIKMFLEKDYGVIMNHKRIRRIMNKYGLAAIIRRMNPYRKMAKATQEHKTCPNYLERNFDQGEPQKVLLTDITYLYYGNGQKAYLSAIKDGATREILAHHISTSLEMDIVYETLNLLKGRKDIYLHPECYLGSRIPLYPPGISV
jgi:transposase InsO family protein